jgi:pimeloyl-ACP methyl ester carboxylesterase
MGPAGKLADALKDSFTVYTYDRRGRGGSGDTQPYSIEREVDDLAAVITLAGGSAAVYGISSGAVLALEAANRGVGVRRLALYEAPVITSTARPPVEDGIARRMENLVGQGRRAEAVRLFMRSVGAPAFVVRLMRFMPAWSKLTAVAHTLPYDFRLLDGLQAGKALPRNRWTSLRVPTIVMDGGKSPEWMRQGNQELSEVLSAQHRTLPGQTHMLKASAVAPVLTEFFS